MHEFPTVDAPELVELYDDPAHMGQLTVDKLPDGWYVSGAVLPRLSEKDRVEFDQWAQVAIDQLLETEDPERNGWSPSSHVPDRWYMTAAVRHLPEI